MDDQLATLTGHVVVCGLGRMGKIVCAELDRQKKWFVLIDKSPELLSELPYKYCLPLHGDATTDELLRKAGIERAKALIAVVGSDADNLYITLSTRLLNPKLLIVARAEEEDAEPKLRKVGANKIISPYLAGGHRAAQAVLRPSVLHFMEMATRPEFMDLQIEEVHVNAGSQSRGPVSSSLAHSGRPGIVVVGIIRPGGELVYNPSGDTIAETDAVLIALGQRRHLEQLGSMAAAN